MLRRRNGSAGSSLRARGLSEKQGKWSRRQGLGIAMALRWQQSAVGAGGGGVGIALDDGAALTGGRGAGGWRGMWDGTLLQAVSCGGGEGGGTYWGLHPAVDMEMWRRGSA
eukprot:5091976-Pleurochrysis_carterae.AAC.1